MLFSLNTVRSIALVAAAGAGSGCAAWSKTRPQDMTVAQHEAAARQERSEAEAAARSAVAVGRGAEWGRAEALRHGRLADEHAQAARRLARDVAAACPSGSDRLPRVLSALNVASVEPIREADVPESRRSGRGYYPQRLKGARLVVMDGTRQDIAAAAQCATLLALAGVPGGGGASPFAVRGAETAVVERGGEAVVEVRAHDSDAAREILRRAEGLASGSQVER